MNITPEKPTCEAPAGACPEASVWLHFHVPANPAALKLLGIDGPVFNIVFARALEIHLHNEGFTKGRIVLLGCVCDGIIQFPTSKLRAALAAVGRYLDSDYEMFACYTTVAWHDERELIYRVVRQGLDLTPFDARLTPERHLARKQMTDLFIEMLREGTRALCQQPTPPLPPE